MTQDGVNHRMIHAPYANAFSRSNTFYSFLAVATALVFIST